MNEVLDRVRLIIAVEGSRKISWENMEFLFEKYDLSEEERQKVLEECKKMGVELFRESSEPSAESAEEENAEKTAEEAPSSEPKKKKKGFFSRLFG